MLTLNIIGLRQPPFFLCVRRPSIQRALFGCGIQPVCTSSVEPIPNFLLSSANRFLKWYLQCGNHQFTYFTLFKCSSMKKPIPSITLCHVPIYFSTVLHPKFLLDKYALVRYGIITRGVTCAHIHNNCSDSKILS